MFLHVKNLTSDVVILDSSSGLSLQKGEERVLQLTVADIEALAPSLETQENLGNITVSVTWDYAADSMWGPYVGGGGGSGGGGFLIWRPNDPAPGSSTKTTWAQVAAELADTGGGIVFVDSTYSGIIDISGAPVDLSRTWFVGVGAIRPTIRFVGGPVPSSPVFRAKNLNILVSTTSTLLRATAGLTGTVHLTDSTVTPLASAFFSTEPGSGATTVLLENSTIETGSEEAFPVSAGEVLQVTSRFSTLGTDVFSGAGDVDVRYDAESWVFNPQAMLAGSLALLPTARASSVAFDDAAVLPRLGDITAPDRNTVQRALDFFKEDRIKGVTINRDLSGQVTSIQKGTDPTIVFSRDVDGRVISLSDGVVEKTFVRNLDGQVTEVIVTIL